MKMSQSAFRLRRPCQVSKEGYSIRNIHTISVGACGRMLKTELCQGWRSRVYQCLWSTEVGLLSVVGFESD